MRNIESANREIPLRSIRSLRERLKEKREAERAALALPDRSFMAEETKNETTVFSLKETRAQQHFIDLFNAAIASPEELLSQQQLEYFSLFQSGKNDAEVAELTSQKLSHIQRQVTHIRKTFEKERFHPRGIYRSTEFDTKVRDACVQGRIFSLKFIRKNYTNEELVEIGRKDFRLPDADLLENGYVPLKDHVTPNEYYVFISKKQYAPYIVRSGNVVLVQQDAIEHLRSVKRTIVYEDVPSPDEGYVRIIDNYKINRTQHSYDAILQALGEGQIPGKKTKSGWYAKKEDVDEFLMTKETE